VFSSKPNLKKWKKIILVFQFQDIYYESNTSEKKSNNTIDDYINYFHFLKEKKKETFNNYVLSGIVLPSRLQPEEVEIG
jgi:uncharacterized membrane protein YvbJ